MLRNKLMEPLLHIFFSRARKVRKIRLLSDAVQRGEMMLHYQPKVDMLAGVTIGVEALLRWQHPLLGLLAPASFSRAMHDDFNGVIDVGHWVAETAIRQIDEWQQVGLAMPVSINLLSIELTQGDFCGWLAGMFEKYPDVSPDMLELEIVESYRLEDIDKVMQVITKCKDMGVKVALDDFGTGYSSLSHVRFLPADHVKIDQSFIRHITYNHQDRGIVQIVISLAEQFGCKVIAEGVESILHGEVLLQLGCRYAQGHAIAKPMSANDFRVWVSKYEGHPEWMFGVKQKVLFG